MFEPCPPTRVCLLSVSKETKTLVTRPHSGAATTVMHVYCMSYSVHVAIEAPMQALYEHLLVEIPFAGFFLCKLTDRGQGRLEAYDSVTKGRVRPMLAS